MSHWKLVNGRWGDAAGNVADVRIDASTNSLNTVGYPHHELHGGNSYTVQQFNSIASGAEFNLGLTTRNTTEWLHFVYEISSTGETILEIFEGATLSGGTAVTPCNRNRNSANTSNTTFSALDPAISGAAATSGTLLLTQSFGVTSNPVQSIGGMERSQQELLLKSGTTYLFVARSASAGNIVSAKVDWYEHTDKN